MQGQGAQARLAAGVGKGGGMSEESWDEMRESLMGLTVRQLRQIARDEGIALGYAASRKDTTVGEIVGTRRHRALNGDERGGRK